MSERRSALEGRLRRSRGKGLRVSRTTGKPAARLSVAAAAGSPVDPLVRTFACGASGEGCSDASDPLMSDRPFAGGDPAVDWPDASDQEMTEGEEGSEESEQEERADGDVLGKGEEAERDVQEDEVGDKQKAADLPGGVSSSEYSWGIHDGTLLWMVISVVLLNVFLRMLPLPGLQTNDPASKVWRISLLLCAHLFAMIIPIRITASVLSVLIGISYGPLLAIAAFHIISPHAGMTIVHLSTAWAAGMFGYNLAQYCLHEGTENAASVAVARTPTRLSKKQRRQRLDTEVYCVVTTSFLTLCFAGRVLWLLFIPSYQDNICMLVVELSVLVWTVLYFWLIILSPLMLHGALISAYSMIRIFAYFVISCIVSVVCYLVSHVLWAYFFALEMMFMAAVIGYSLAVFQHYKGLLKQKRRQCFTVRPRRKMTVVTRRHAKTVKDTGTAADEGAALSRPHSPGGQEPSTMRIGTDEISNDEEAVAINKVDAETVQDKMSTVLLTNSENSSREDIRTDNTGSVNDAVAMRRHAKTVKDTSTATAEGAALSRPHSPGGQEPSTMRIGTDEISSDEEAVAINEVGEEVISSALIERVDAESVQNKMSTVLLTNSENSSREDIASDNTGSVNNAVAICVPKEADAAFVEAENAAPGNNETSVLENVDNRASARRIETAASVEYDILTEDGVDLAAGAADHVTTESATAAIYENAKNLASAQGIGTSDAVEYNVITKEGDGIAAGVADTVTTESSANNPANAQGFETSAGVNTEVGAGIAGGPADAMTTESAKATTPGAINLQATTTRVTLKREQTVVGSKFLKGTSLWWC